MIRKLATACHHRDRKHAALGLCKPCYSMFRLSQRENRLPVDEAKRSKLRRQMSTRQCAARLSLKVLTHYSLKGVLGCSCPGCDVVIEDFLTIDHINGMGNQQRKQTGSGTSFYYWLKRNGFPSGYQTLCCNCNFARGKNGGDGICPHLKV